MKFAVFFAFAAFAFVAQANAKSLDGSDRGAMIDALKTKLAEAKDKLADLLDKAQDKLKEQIAEAQKKLENFIDQVKDKTTQISDELYQAAQKFLDKVGEFEDKLVEKANNIVNNNKKE